MIFEMIWWGLGGPRTSRRRTTRALIMKGHRRRKAEREYVKMAVRRMELRADARRIYAQRHPVLPHVIPGAAPESRYSNSEFWERRRQPQGAPAYRDPRDFWSR